MRTQALDAVRELHDRVIKNVNRFAAVSSQLIDSTDKKDQLSNERHQLLDALEDNLSECRSEIEESEPNV